MLKYRNLGIALALIVPSLAVAAVELPNVFADGDVISAEEMNANFDALADKIEELEELKERPSLQVGTMDTLAAVDPGIVTYQAVGDGMLVTRHQGPGGYSDNEVIIWIGNEFDADTDALTCDGETCADVRSPGASVGELTVAVGAGQYIRVDNRDPSSNDGTILLRWIPLTSETALPTDVTP